MGASRLLVFGGIALIAAGMLFGDIFAVFVLHQNGGETGRALLNAAQATKLRKRVNGFARPTPTIETQGATRESPTH